MKRNKQQPDGCQVIIFGGTGDLAQGKLLPGFYKLARKDLLSNDFSVVGIGRRYEDREEYLRAIYQALEDNVAGGVDEQVWANFRQQIDYQQFSFREDAGYQALEEKLTELETEHNLDRKRIFYLATAPNFFGLIVDKLQSYGLVESAQSTWPRVVIEKPFGYDLESARELNERITAIFPEDNIYRIDHYLGKQMMQNILVIRFANLLFEPIWNQKYIDNIQIVASEPNGVKERGKYYDRSGTLKDMVQNHMLQILALTAMEPPVDLETESIRREKIKVLQALPQFKAEQITDQLVLGQYTKGTCQGQKVRGYQAEPEIAADSKTETFAAVKLFIDNLRWAGVPFYIKTGKRLPQKKTEIIVEFKSDFHPALQAEFDLNPDLLRIKIQPEEGVVLQFNAKEPGSRQKIVPAEMNFCQNCQLGINTPEAYEELLLSLINGDQSLFTHWEEVKYSWQFIDQLVAAKKEQGLEVERYSAGTTGPQAAEELMINDNRKWRDKEAKDENS